ncbi:hypothetical protein M3649_04275 [Ureibacillus chungkukjangi]|uniref:hypothetical protein n=1 Tax=Ureibacillus chungkukjangi TaxID=1202712 RepID=UPI002041BC86|nr:hypothetical protein [Ureibacillus chungkukjangi]MCM3387350.1 hypothetical protein [Ureibacillus chungkukjangi]
MARISYGSVTQNSVILLVVELNTASTYSEVYITINGQTSPNLAWGGNGNSSSRQWQATGLSPGTTYYASYYISTGINSGSGGTYITTDSPPQDTTAPTINYQSATGIGLLRLGWSAYDNSGGSGISYYRTYVGSPNGGTDTLVVKDTLYAGATSAEWTLDANNNALQVNMWYWVGVRVYDVAGNSSLLTYRIQFKRQRPADWSWGLTFTSGQNVNITASKWNDFTLRINQFRFYQGLTNYSFTTVVSGNPIYAYQINEAIIAIRAMNSNILSNQYSGQNAVATVLTSISSALNNIT